MATEGSPLYAPEWAAIAKQDLIILIIIVGFLNFQIGSQMFVVIWIFELFYCTLSNLIVNVEGINFATQTHHVRKARRRERKMEDNDDEKPQRPKPQQKPKPKPPAKKIKKTDDDDDDGADEDDRDEPPKKKKKKSKKTQILSDSDSNSD